MHVAQVVGRKAAAQKYDLLTALGAHALSQGKHEQRLVLRFMTLITARYNWNRDELAVGQREIAQLWSVDERTVKREMAKLRALGWLRVHRQGARGRVTQYGLNIECMLEATQQTWSNVGPDFDLRMHGTPATSDVVALPVKGQIIAPEISDGTEWALARGILHAENQGVYGSWIQALTRVNRAGGRLSLRAPSRFHAAYVQTHLSARLLAAVQAVDSDVSEIAVVL
ncbi:hypothetical protein [uncultured Sulfitobacter sp.]|uniref:hypothetical protein n=1 Tax=uncultured Sulfitobacter sp. TaxID=191468 RepID=UPI00262225C4|nr:hypothetical protein [uncultured Sulfitobacter sp.]